MAVTEGRAVGRALFAACLLMVGGVLNVIYGIAGISNSNFFAHNTHYVFGDLRAWGWATLIVGVVELCASASLFGGGTFGRLFGILVGSIAAIEALLAIPAYPFLALASFALSVWIVYGLAVYQAPEPVSYEDVATGAGRSTGSGATMAGTGSGRRS